jgi:hypothetical protein
MHLKETGHEGVEWIHLTQNNDQWQTVRNKAMNLKVHKKAIIS